MAEPKTIPELKARIEADAKRLVEMVEEDMTKRASEVVLVISAPDACLRLPSAVSFC